jgi:hypothetical protein
MNQKYNWLRWVIILPACTIIYLLAFVLLNIYFTYTRSPEQEPGEGSLVNLFAPGIAAGIAAYGTISLGVYIAPNYKKNTGLIIFVILIILVGMGITLLILKNFNYKLLLEIIGQSIGAFAGHQTIKEENRN